MIRALAACGLAALVAIPPAAAAPTPPGPVPLLAAGAAPGGSEAFARRPATTWIKHLNLATNEPISAGLITGDGGWLEPGRLVCHGLLVRHARGLLLVDTGLGTKDVEAARDRFLAPYRWLVRPKLDPRETARAQLARMGLPPEAVTDIALTHVDLDHAGGLADFPHARVHVLAPELGRYADGSQVAQLAKARFAHGVRWAAHRPAARWEGFAAARLPIAGVDVRLVALPGHTPGHAGVAVRAGDRWLLHAGDAYLHRHELSGAPGVPVGMKAFRLLRDEDDATRAKTLRALRRLARRAGDRVAIFSAHDAPEYRARTAPERAFAAVRRAARARPREAAGPGNGS